MKKWASESDPPPRIFYSSSTVLELFGAPEKTEWGGVASSGGPQTSVPTPRASWPVGF